MSGTTKDDVDPEKMMSTELHAHFTQLLVGRAHNMNTRLGDVDSKISYAMEKIDGLEESFNAKLDAKFQEVLAWLPQPGVHTPRARGVPLSAPPTGTVTTATAAIEAATHDGYATDEGKDKFEDENELDEEEVQHLDVVMHDNTTATLVHLHDRYVMMNMLQN
jgi:hypothetical protein